MGRKKKKKQKNITLKVLQAIATFLFITLPVQTYKLIRYLIQKTKKQVKKQTIKQKRKQIHAKNQEFKILQTNEGNYNDWKKTVLETDSSIGIILGARGTGKTALGISLLENIYSKTKKQCYAMGFNEEELPSWIEGVNSINQIENNSYILIDEGGILFNSRKSMSSANTLLSKLLLIARHKNLSILFISQNSSNLEVNILRQADFLLLKPSSLLQKDFERKIIQNIYKETQKDFKKHKEHKGLTYIYSDTFRGFINNKLPSFWGEKLSKGFANK